MNVLEQIDPELGRMLFGHQTKPRPVRGNKQSEPSRPAEDRGLLRRAKEAGLSTVAAIGNVLDLPGSMVRDVISYQSPLGQILTLTSSAQSHLRP